MRKAHSLTRKGARRIVRAGRRRDDLSGRDRRTRDRLAGEAAASARRRRVPRVGGLKDLPLDVRVIAASNRDLKRKRGREIQARPLLPSLRHPDRSARAARARRRVASPIITSKTSTKSSGSASRGHARSGGDFPPLRVAGCVRANCAVERAMILEDDDLITSSLARGVTPGGHRATARSRSDASQGCRSEGREHES